ncbi:tetratricopeptide repeat-containing sulfotransferase family protein [Rhodanobacter geophilus]|uniref:Sulfotransferase n=1 Tax=Rhodanobacter geophilus TaxID=3162488 RepID=A0ABV3QP26_9GAMM
MSHPPSPPSPTVRRLLAEAGTALSQRRPDDAERALTSLLALAPDNVDARYLLGIACLMRGDSAQAVGFLRAAAHQRPGDANIQTNLGSALHDAGAVEEALVCLRRACELAPGQASAWYNLGKALKLQRRLDEAEHALGQALALDANHLSARITLADIHTIRGGIAAAAREYRNVLQRQPEYAAAWHALANLKTEPFGPGDVRRLQQALRKPGLDAESRILLGFALFKALEDQGDQAAAFEALREANTLKRRQVRWDAAGEHAHVAALMESFRDPPARPLDASLGQEVILIASLPRSGSTLVEQILATHPDVDGANETDLLEQIIDEESRRRGMAFPGWVATASPQDWDRLGRDYLVRAAHWRRGKPRFTDKSLTNWQLTGAALAMLPGARVVNCHRDPVETCFACYRQLFSGGAHFSYDLDEMAAHCKDYQRLTRYWLERHPARVLDFSYEALLKETELQVRRLLDFCGLGFDPACLAPHRTHREVHSTASAAQVRQPLRADTSRAGHYAAQLATLRSRFES